MNSLKIILIFFTPMFCSCQKKDVNKILAEKFISTLIQDQKINEIQSFLKIDSLTSEKMEFNLKRVIEINVAFLRSNLKICSTNYEIIKHSEIKNEFLKEYMLEYEYPENVYYVTCKNKILTHIIVRNNKVVSFFSKLMKTEEQKFIPWILD
ncbi:MAG: hypothetical protein ACK48F_15320 [Chryseotalea sp.]